MLTAINGGRQLVAGCCARAAAAGVHPGMTLAHARALLPADQILVEDLDEARDRTAMAALAQWALRFSPSVMVDPFPHASGLLMDITGCQRLFRGEGRLVNQLADALMRMGFHVRVASAPTFGCAWALARFGQHDRFVLDGDGETLRDALTPLPVRALRIDDATTAALHEVGIDRIEHLLALPRQSLPVRFGPQLLLRLDQALGHVAEMIEPVRPAPPPCVERAFDGPVKQLEAIELTVRELLSLLAQQLLHRESGVRELTAAFERVDAQAIVWSLALSRPTRDVKHLWSLLRPRVEKVNLGYGIERIRLTATRAARLAHRQTAQAREAVREDDVSAQQLAQLVDALSERLGAEHVTRIVTRQTHIPERAYEHAAAATTAAVAVPEVAPGDQPSQLYDQPQAVQVMAMTPDGPPCWLRWGAHEYRVITSAGPQRIAPQWWRFHTDQSATGNPHDAHGRTLATRDYFKVQVDTGRWFWLYRLISPVGRPDRWFMHGEWA